MSLRETASRAIVFPGKRPWLTMLGSLLMVLCAAGLLVYMVYGLVLTVIAWIEGPVGFWLVFESLLFLALFAIIGTLMLIGIVFFGRGLLGLWKECLRPSNVVELLPEGIRGKTNIGDIMIPWSCIASVRLELSEKEATIGIETIKWPPYPLWKDCSGGVRRMLWQRHKRRQPPLYLFIHEASASPETILQAIENELTLCKRTVLESE